MSLQDAKLLTTPNAYKAGKLYSIKPLDGSGDFTASRATTATRVNENGLIESVAVNVPRIDYTNADCPVLAIEPQRTNLVEKSFGDFTKSIFTSGDKQINLTEQSDSNPFDLSSLNIETTGTIGSALIRSKDFFTNVNKNYTLSFYAKKNTNTTTEIERIRISENNSSFDDIVVQNLSLTSNYKKYKFTITRTQNSPEVNQVHFIFYNSDINIIGLQLEEGLNATSDIITDGNQVTRNQDILTNDLTSTIDASYSALIKVEADNSRLKIEDTNTGFDLPLNGTGNIAMVVDNQITFHFPDNGQANTTVTYDKPADLRNWEILSKLGRTGLAILSIENGAISQNKIDDWVSGTISSDWLQDYSTQTDFGGEFREQDWDYFPAIDLSNGSNFQNAWRDNNLTSFPAIDLSNGTNFVRAWRFNNLTSFPAIDLSSGTNFFAAWSNNSLTSFPEIDLSSGTNFSFAWSGNSLTSFPAIDLSNGTDFGLAWRDNSLTSFPAIDLSSGTDFSFAWRLNNLTSFPANMFDNNNASNYERAFEDNALDQTSVDNILVSIEASAQANNITNGELGIDGGTNATPSATGQAAADSLRNTFNWTVELNGY